ncbi:hypothetical protein VIGAN_03192400 [Vigna angularis var. angularis]|uniref:Uncharacterized protein n=1 Tax=Vigna angularis var. angularis TaxID=157739 RepID=A0A0S3RN51_PHAAN|nr:hypothetical protein VIGAN_03192400 [Vigna angularis var. angularis]
MQDLRGYATRPVAFLVTVWRSSGVRLGLRLKGVVVYWVIMIATMVVSLGVYAVSCDLFGGPRDCCGGSVTD